ncbi:MAG: hypothetical protein KA439_12565 [Rhizobacter sp.]|jgi:hypothetical protein|nr:hypothetical protein [Rhizobacter sp.]MBP6270393.1 hypothetical protein [Rhizobacter sp.]
MSNYTSRTGSPYTDRPAPPPIENDGWESTRAQTALATQIMDREGDAPPAYRQEIGRPVGNDVRELFVACAPGEALQQQFEHLHPEFIAVHDLATRSSRQLLRGIAAASNRAVQKLVLRRQGGGAPVATIDFIEVPVSAQETLRIYSTDIDDTTDAAARHAVARTLLAYSQLGVMMVGAMPAENIHALLRPWHEELIRSPWLNRNLLLLPLTNTPALTTNGQNMVRGTSITLRTTPVVTRPADAWNFINGTWGRLRGAVSPLGAPAAPARSVTTDRAAASQPPVQSQAAARVSAQIDAGYRAPALPDDPSGFAPTNLLPLRPMPDVRARPVPMQDEVLEVYVHQVCELNGVVGCCVFDIGSGLPVAHGGAGAPPEELARHGRALLSAMGTTSRALGLGHTLPDAAITLGSHHLLLRSVAKHAGMALLTVLDRTNANLTLARLQIERLDPLLDR